MARIYKLDGGDFFEGTAQQFCDRFGGEVNEEWIRAWCTHSHVKLEVYDTVDPATEEENPHGLTVAGYSNITALHPRGSYIGWSRGPTVFAGPLAYMSEVNERLDQAAEREDDLQEESVRTLFLRLLEEAKNRTPYGTPFSGDEDNRLLVSCSIPSRWFMPIGGRYNRFTPEYVAEMPLEDVQRELINLIAQSFAQR